MFKKPLQLPCYRIVNQKEIDELHEMKIDTAPVRDLVWVDFYNIDVVEDNALWQPEFENSPKSHVYSGSYYWECHLSKIDVRSLIEKHISDLDPIIILNKNTYNKK